MSAQAIGYRALAVNLSDLAAMGAMPRLALLSMALPPALPLADFDGIGDGLAELAARAATHIVGGNLTRTPGPLTIDITVVGTVKPRRALTRSGARPGDDLYVTGTIGAAIAGLQILQATHSTQATHVTHSTHVACIDRYRRPVPRLRAGALLARNRVATACIDLSDGLAEAAHQMAEASGVGIALDADTIPIDAAARDWFVSRGADPVAAALTGGDDYELLFAVRPKMRRRAQALARFFDVPMTRVGVCTADGGASLIRSTAAESRPLPLPRGYGHFR
jgi:thiamine-monophosphate kinase